MNENHNCDLSNESSLATFQYYLWKFGKELSCQNYILFLFGRKGRIRSFQLPYSRAAFCRRISAYSTVDQNFATNDSDVNLKDLNAEVVSIHGWKVSSPTVIAVAEQCFDLVSLLFETYP